MPEKQYLGLGELTFLLFDKQLVLSQFLKDFP